MRNHGSVARDEEGRPLRVIGSLLDITELKAVEEQLRQAAKMEAVGRLAGGLAHDFNNQLHALIGFANFVARDSGLSGGARSDLLEIQKAAERMASLTRQLLAFSRQQVLAPETLDLNRALAEAQSLLQRLIGTNIEVSLEMAPGPVWVRVDPAQLTQIFLNLAVNARDAMPHGGRFSLKTDVAPGSFARLEVSDTGIGIAPEHLPRIFDPFFTTKEVGQGTGLGLATVHGIVAQSEGHLEVESEPGRGTRFTLLLPLAPPPAVGPRRTHPEPGHARRVLVVEDEEPVRAIIVRVLADERYEVLQVTNGSEALECLARLDGAVDLILSDVVMPGLGGGRFAEALAESYPALPVIWMSGYPREEAFADSHVSESLFPAEAGPSRPPGGHGGADAGTAGLVCGVSSLSIAPPDIRQMHRWPKQPSEDWRSHPGDAAHRRGRGEALWYGGFPIPGELSDLRKYLNPVEAHRGT